VTGFGTNLFGGFAVVVRIGAGLFCFGSDFLIVSVLTVVSFSVGLVTETFSGFADFFAGGTGFLLFTSGFAGCLVGTDDFITDLMGLTFC
jgi:hypothetical protein